MLNQENPLILQILIQTRKNQKNAMSEKLKELRRNSIITTICAMIIVPVVLYFLIFTDLRTVESRAVAFVNLGIAIMLGYSLYKEWKLKKQKKAEQNNE